MKCPYCKKPAPLEKELTELGYRYWVWCVNFACLVRPRTDHFPTKQQALDVWDLPYQEEKIEMSQEVEDLIRSYIALRDELAKITKTQDVQKRKYSAVMENMSARLGVVMQELGVSQLKAEGVGTAFTKETDFINIIDWPSFIKFVMDNDTTQMLNKSASKTSVKEYMSANDGALPPGLKYGCKKEIQVRKA